MRDDDFDYLPDYYDVNQDGHIDASDLAAFDEMDETEHRSSGSTSCSNSEFFSGLGKIIIVILIAIKILNVVAGWFY